MNIVVFTGAGISAESGLKTFRGEDGLWEGYRVEDVATPEAWHKDPELVQHFYNIRRKAVRNAQPNAAHKAIAQLEEKFDVVVITQNIDDLHERAGSKNIIHLHGLITKSQSSLDSNLIYNIVGDEIKMGQLCEKRSQLRPHVVWFGEAVPMMTKAIEVCKTADIFLIIGTSLQVYPAATLINYVSYQAKRILIDPAAEVLNQQNKTILNIPEKASLGVPKVVRQLLNQ
ncbi:SIR2 family NAD-dependent protein deacylase [Olivibacter domesticus]|uniref:NAD-dependent protein deacylase n=1 Tax=Olivibacter domesticus TaxID=407022 RepID=A0A1H7HYL1_OLID1|nr:NAD-dependent deacylase [Olivibacter domesticus]SEK54682.1 NAD-dependent deacetylase [Olivibacter domesticus]